jgi:CubicO group peptidase (beta-lactamase class C family)
MHSTLWTAGAMYSTAEEMVRWLNSLYGGQVLTPASLKQMQTDVLIPTQDRLSGAGISEEAYGLCAIRYTFLGKPLWGHTGSFYGYASMGTYRPEDGVSVAVLSNWRWETSSLMRIHIFESISALYQQLVTSVSEGNSIPSSITLEQNYPNPFNPSTTIRYGLPNRSYAALTIFNTLGQEVAVLQNGEQEAGYHEVLFDGKNLSSGVYFYRIQAGDFVQTKRLLLLK